MNTFPSNPGAYRLEFEIKAEGAVSGLRLPHLLVVGAKSGPETAITAGQHGREAAGMLAAATAFRDLDPAGVNGRVHVFPSLNPIALRLGVQDYPTESNRYRKAVHADECNLDRLWGREDALDPLLPAITRQLWEGCLAGCDHLLDLHCWSEFFCPMAWACERDKALLTATGFPFITVRNNQPTHCFHTLRDQAWSVEKPVVVLELGGQNVVRAESLALGKRTLRNFLIACGHLDEAPQPAARQVELQEGGRTSTLEAPANGLWHPLRGIGEIVAAGDVLGEILCLETFETLAEVTAEIPGLLLFNGPAIWGEDQRERQLIYRGQRLVKIQEVAGGANMEF